MDTTVIKIGGALISDPAALETMWEAVKDLHASRHVVLVHGGGPRATQLAKQLGHTPRMVHGRRVTTDLDLDIVKWTMRGELNSRLVAGAFAHGVRAVGVSGADGAILQVVKRPAWDVDGEMVDFGWVGGVETVDPFLLRLLADAGYVPVVAPMGIDRAGQLFNVNADTVSCALAGAMGAAEYLLVTESGGVRRNASDPGTLLARCDASHFERGVEEGWIEGGMRVKLKVAFDALRAGVGNVYIVSPEGILHRESGTRVIE